MTTFSISRREFVRGVGLTIGGATLAACSVNDHLMSESPDLSGTGAHGAVPPLYAPMYGPLYDDGFHIPAVDLSSLDPELYRREVEDPTGERPGTVVVETGTRRLYHVMENGRAMRYGVGIGRDGFAWSGWAIVAYKRKWPVWTPPAEMIEREPRLETYRNGMEPGPDNPLGARALYIHEGGKDTLYRVHGSTDASSIGKAVSSGCVRLLHQDVIHLHDRVRDGSPILVV